MLYPSDRLFRSGAPRAQISVLSPCLVWIRMNKMLSSYSSPPSPPPFSLRLLTNNKLERQAVNQHAQHLRAVSLTFIDRQSRFPGSYSFWEMAIRFMCRLDTALPCMQIIQLACSCCYGEFFFFVLLGCCETLLKTCWKQLPSSSKHMWKPSLLSAFLKRRFRLRK